MSTPSPTSPTHLTRPSRFIEGEPLTHSPSTTTSPLFASILSEQDEHESRFRSSSRSRQDSHSSSNSNSSSSPNDAIAPRTPPYSQKQSHSPTSFPESEAAPRGIGALPAAFARGRSSFEASSLKETRGEKLVGRLRALTTNQGSLERKIQTGKVVPYPGT